MMEIWAAHGWGEWRDYFIRPSLPYFALAGALLGVTARVSHELMDRRPVMAAATVSPDLFHRDAAGSFRPLIDAVVIEEWQGGCRVRIDQQNPSADGATYYVKYGASFVALKLSPEPTGKGPFDYAAALDFSDAWKGDGY